MIRLVCIVLGALLLPRIAFAERAVLLPVRSEVSLEPTELARLLDALAHALRSESFEPVADAATSPCSDAACITARIADAGAQRAVELVLWRAPDGGVSGVSVSIIASSGERYSAGARTTAGAGLSEALARATLGAIERLRRGPGPWLQVDGSPSGASITVDGQAAGALPRRVKVSGGLHRVLVSSAGHEPLEQTVTVPRNPDALKHLEVNLRLADASNEQDHARAQASPWNYVIAGAAAAAGMFLSIGPLQSLARDGECGRKDGDVCTGVVAFDGGQGLQLAAAGLFLGGSVAFALWSPLTVNVDESGARVAASGHF